LPRKYYLIGFSALANFVSHISSFQSERKLDFSARRANDLQREFSVERHVEHGRGVENERLLMADCSLTQPSAVAPNRSLTNILNCRVEPLKPHAAQPANIAQLRIVADWIGAALARQD
jgi:hypothetical protein